MRELLGNYVEFRRIGVHVAIGCRVGGDGRVDVKAIDRRAGVALPLLACECAAGCDHGSAEVDITSVVAVGAAEPGVGGGIVIRGGGLGWCDA